MRTLQTVAFASALIRPIVAATAIAVALTPPTSPALTGQQVVEIPVQDRPLDAGFAEIFRVGVLDGESWETLNRVVKVAFDAQSNLYVFDRGVFLSSDLRVLVFDQSSRFLRGFGSAGDGPGEFRMPRRYAVNRDGQTIVSDVRAYHVFDENGKFVHRIRPSTRSQRDLLPSEILPDPRGGAVFAGDFGTGEGPPGGNRPQPTSRPIMRLELDDALLDADTVLHAWLPPLGEPGEGLPKSIEVEGGVVDLTSAYGNSALPRALSPRLLVGILPDGGIVYSDSSAYALKVTSSGSSEPVRVITRPFRPRPVTPAIREEFKEGAEAGVMRAGAEGSAVGTALRITNFADLGPVSGMPELTFYPEVPVLRDLSVTWEGRIWVGRTGERLEGAGPIDVLTPEGGYIGTFLPGATAMPDAFGPDGLAAFIEKDEMDVARVVVRRLPAAVR